MKKQLLVFLLFAINFSQAQTTYPSFHSYNAITILNDTISLSQYAGKKLLVVNTASFCGFTPQYADLEQLYTLYGGPNFEILGFPCDDFGHQEPGDDSTINVFCTGTYNVTFQMMSKISITAPDTTDFYKWLQRQDLNGVSNATVTWNFNKFLIDEAGHWVAHYPQTVNPLDTAIVNWILSPNTTGIIKNNNSDLISLLANPVKENISLTISANASSIVNADLYSSDGRFIENIYTGFPHQTITVNKSVAELPQGIYLLKTYSSDKSGCIKISILK